MKTFFEKLMLCPWNRSRSDAAPTEGWQFGTIQEDRFLARKLILLRCSCQELLRFLSSATVATRSPRAIWLDLLSTRESIVQRYSTTQSAKV